MRRNRCKPPIEPMIWKTRRTILDLADRARVMGILNVTPDSFSDGGRHCAPDEALGHGRRMIGEGAEIIDIGGESTRPGAAAISADEEMARTVPILSALRDEWDGLISIDTMKASVAAAALAAGADIVNDVSGLRADPAMAGICAESGCGVVVMHMQGTPRTMQIAPYYEDVVAEVRAFFKERLASLTAAGIAAEALCFDPGIGFGKTLAHNVALLRALAELSVGGRPLLLGVSRKSFLMKILGENSTGEWPTVALTARAYEAGVRLHRVHAVRPNLEALRMTEAILSSATSVGG
jgi:dihydropteroate synthase